LLGGSHGGWIGAHMSMQYPNLFKQVILLNPVTDLILNSFVSDIADWSFFESGRTYDFTHPSLHYTPQDLLAMEKLNPKSHFQDGKSYPKTMIVLGEKDLRVPLANGLRWVEFLKSHQLEVEAYILPGTGHALTGVEQELALFNLLMKFILN
jgi:acylaminoacyl-peptidase